jgi:hypothetical protein
MSKVYMTQRNTTFNIAPALEFGEVVTILPERASAYGDVSDFIHIARNKLADFTEEDYLLPTGDPVLIGAIFALAARKTDGYLQVLKWDARGGVYRKTIINLDAMPD